MRRPALLLASLLCCFAITATLSAQDVDDHQGVSNILGAGARAWGMGGAFMALADDATAASWNPAGLAQLVKPEVSLVIDGGKGNVEWRYRYLTTDANRRQIIESVKDTGRTDYSAIGFASATYPLRLRGSEIVGQLSYRRLSTFPGILNPYRTSTTELDANQNVINSTQDANIYETSYSGGYDAYAASIAASFGQKVKLGITMNDVRGSVTSTSMVAGSGGHAALAADLGMAYSFTGLAFDIGALYSPVPRIALAAVYHKGFSAPFWYESSLRTTEITPQVTGGRSRMTWPDSYGLGAAYKPTQYLTISADAARTEWAKATVDSMKVAGLTYDSARGWKPEWATLNGLGFPYFGLQQHNTTNLRLGVEYVTFYKNVGFPVRAGMFKEDQATNAWDQAGDLQETPRYSGYTAGVGMSLGHVQVDLAYIRTVGSDRGRSQELNGTTMTDFEIARVKNQRMIISALYRF